MRKVSNSFFRKFFIINTIVSSILTFVLALGLEEPIILSGLLVYNLSTFIGLLVLWGDSK